MEFLKSNLLKLIGIVLMSVVAVFALITSINAFLTASGLRDIPEAMQSLLPGNPFDVALSQTNAGAFSYLAIFLAATFIIAALVIKMFGLRKIAGITLVAGSVVALSMFVTGIILGSDFIDALSQNAETTREAYNAMRELPTPPPGSELLITAMRAARAAYITQISQVVIFVIAFGVTPLVLGIKMLVCKKEA